MTRHIFHSAGLLVLTLVHISCAHRDGHSSMGAPSGGQIKPSAAVRQQLKQFHPVPAPKQTGLFLKKGDKLAICGDSITEQKMYARIMETYLTVCTPELEISTRQFGWSGEKADGFLARMTNDVLRFDPTVATLCYG